MVVKNNIKPPKKAVFKNRLSAAADIIITVIITVDKYIIIVSCSLSLRALIVTFLVRNARITATIWVANIYANRSTIHIIDLGPSQTRLLYFITM